MKYNIEQSTINCVVSLLRKRFFVGVGLFLLILSGCKDTEDFVEIKNETGNLPSTFVTFRFENPKELSEGIAVRSADEEDDDYDYSEDLANLGLGGDGAGNGNGKAAPYFVKCDPRLDEVRVFVFKSYSGELVVNQLYITPNQPVEKKYGTPQGVKQPWSGGQDLGNSDFYGKSTAKWVKPIELQPGLYDFYFVGNETLWDLKSKLESVKNRDDLYNLKIEYEPNKDYYFHNGNKNVDLTAKLPEDMRCNIVSTAAYLQRYIAPTRDGRGNTIADPQHFLGDGSERVWLIYCMARIELKIDDVVGMNMNEADKSKLYRSILSFKNLDCRKINLNNIPKYISLFKTPLMGSQYYCNEKYFTSEYFPATGGGYEKVEYQLEDEPNLELKNVNFAQAELGQLLYSDKNAIFVPELLLEAGKDGIADPENEKKYETIMGFRFLDDKSKSVYNIPIKHGVFNINVVNPVNPADREAYLELVKKANADYPGIYNIVKDWSYSMPVGRDYYTMPLSEKYSQFSILRGTKYVISAKEKADRIYMKYDVKNWDDYTTEPAYVGAFFNVFVEDTTFTKTPNKIKIVSTLKDPQRYPINYTVDVIPHTDSKMKFSDSNTVLKHTNTQYQSKTESTLTKENSTEVVPQNTGMLDIYLNGTWLYTIRKP